MPFTNILRAFSAALAALSLGAGQPFASAQEAEHSPADLSSPTLGYDHGFFIRSRDGRNEIVLEGLFQTLLRGSESSRKPQSEVEIKRMRLEVAGTFDEHYRFRVETKFSPHEVELEEAWLGAELFGGQDLLMIGRMKAPFGLEEVRSRRYIPFPQFSIMQQFVPAEQHGLFLNGNAGRAEYGIGLYNGGDQKSHDDGEELAARLMWHPFRGDFSTTFESLQFGLAATYGQEERDLTGGSIRNAAGLPLMHYADAVSVDGTQWRLGLEAAWYDGPYMLQAEWIHIEEELSRIGAQSDVAHDGGYVMYQQVLSGATDISFAGVSPKSSVNPYGGGGSGALALALRLSVLESDDALQDLGFLQPGQFTPRVTSLSAGLNWYLSSHALLRTSFVHSIYSSDVSLEGTAQAGEIVGDESALMVEFQMHF